VRLQPPESVRALQRALYRKAKSEPTFRFYLLYDKVHRADLLGHAWALVRANGGAAGVDGITIAAVEAGGVGPFLARLAEELRTHTYRPDPVRRVAIPKRSGGERPLGIPTVRDRVVQAAAVLVLEPVFEADFQPCSYGFRPKRDAHQAVDDVSRALAQGYTQVLDADLTAYLDTATYCPPIHGAPAKRLGCVSNTLIRKPLRRPQRTCTASSSPRLTRCNTVCRETLSRRVASSIGRYPGGASSTKRARSVSVIRIRHGAPGVSCSPTMKPSRSQR
jgi:RNA-directed DNA polymerase